MAGETTSKTWSQVDPCKETLQTVCKDGKGVEAYKKRNEWRMKLPSHFQGRECMVLCSGGDSFAPFVDVVPKLRDRFMVDSELQLLRKELDVVQQRIKHSELLHLVHVCPDFPGAQLSKSYYLEMMKQLMTECKQPGGKFHL